MKYPEDVYEIEMKFKEMAIWKNKAFGWSIASNPSRIKLKGNSRLAWIHPGPSRQANLARLNWDMDTRDMSPNNERIDSIIPLEP